MPSAKLLPRLNLVDFFRYREDELASSLCHSIRTSIDRFPEIELKDEHLAIAAWFPAAYNVPNGGFAQLFYNHGDLGVRQLADQLEQLGVDKAAKAFREALTIYDQHRSKFNVSNPWEELFGGIEEFNPCDRDFMKVLNRCNRELDAWVRSRADQLFVDEANAPIDVNFTGTAQSFSADGKVKESLQVKKGKAQGSYCEYFEDGTIRQSLFYKSGKVSGDYWPNGRVKRKESKKDALRIIEWFDPNGCLLKRYVQNKEGYVTEPIRVYHANGQLAEEMNFVKDQKRGAWLRFFEDGTPELQANYEQDESLVVLNAWNEKREQIVKDGNGTFCEYATGIDWAHDIYHDNHLTTNWELKEGIPHGKATSYYDGVLWSIDQYVEGKKHGESTTYWDNGRVRMITPMMNGKPGACKQFPKFDNPRPAVVLSVDANERLYRAWRHIPVDEYPRPLNLEEVRQQLRIPQFLLDVYQRNQNGVLNDDYEDWNTFNDGIAYFLTVNPTGEVIEAHANGSGVYSGGEWDTYLPLLRQLRFAPGRLRGKGIECRVLTRVDHTFIEAAT